MINTIGTCRKSTRPRLMMLLFILRRDQDGRMCCKNGLAAHLNYSAPQSERLIDEQDKPNHISFRQPRHLAFPDHVYRFVALNRPPGSMEGPKPLAGVNPPFDRPVVLFHDVVQVGTGATATSSAQFSCCLQFRDHLGV